MKRIILLSTVIACVAGFLLLCGDDGGEINGPGPAGNEVIGTWVEIIPANPLFGIPETLTITLDVIESDSTYSLSVNQPDDTLFIHNGYWEISNDTLILNGTEGFLVDTTANPDTLAPLPPAVMSIPIAIPINLTSPTQWPVKAGDLGPVIDAFPVPNDIKIIIQGFNLLLEKQ